MKKYIPIELIENARIGDSQALADLLEKSEKTIKHVSFSFGLESEVEDILQEIKFKIYKELPHFRNPFGYYKFVRKATRNHCLNILKKKKPLLLEGANGDQILFDTQSIWTSSEEQYGKTKQQIVLRDRIERVAKALDREDAVILKMKHIEGKTIKEISKLRNLKKSSCHEVIQMAKVRWIAEEAGQDYANSHYEQAREKLIIIYSYLKPSESSNEKRYLLASTLLRLGKIYQLWGQPNKSIHFLLHSRQLWEDLRDKTMASNAIHMIALDYNIIGKYEHASRLLMIATMEPFDDRTLEPPEDRGYGAK